jgi:hypothetical protein
MTRTAFLLALIVTTLASVPAHAQQRVFVSGHGLDTNPCSVTQPCRTFQRAFNIAPVNSEIDVLDPAGYGPLVITHGISIQAHGIGGISQPASTDAAITVNVPVSVTEADHPVMLNGLLIDGAGTGQYGIHITSAVSVQIHNSVIRHFNLAGIFDDRINSGAVLLVEDTTVSENAGTGINLAGRVFRATLSRITANYNGTGVLANSNNNVIANSVISNNEFGSGLANLKGYTWLAKTVISGNGTGVVVQGGTVMSYGDNYISFDNGTEVSGILTPVTTR